MLYKAERSSHLAAIFYSRYLLYFEKIFFAVTCPLVSCRPGPRHGVKVLFFVRKASGRSQILQLYSSESSDHRVKMMATAVVSRPSAGMPSFAAAFAKLWKALSQRCDARITVEKPTHSCGVAVMDTVKTATKPSTAGIPGTDILSAWLTPSAKVV